ncbi:MAG: OFA family MFS transporter [Succiniclasticum sp.]|jgi:OFA family oxalate/formate antiporter-like MFS transporter|nr:OFA family MFS transporter [Succiniclasticum sp.]MDY6303199.1 OFA family MFS transporter [Succiniclasticum sp.]MDY6345775.1 OFA family MFS transporter [Succiniclasticum sp.]
MKNKWLIALSAVGIHICIGSVYAWSVLTRPIMSSMGFTQKEVTWIFSIAILFLGLSAGFLGDFVEKHGPRKSGLAAAAFFGTGMLGSALALHLHSLALLYLFYGVIGGIGLGIGYITPVSTLVKWFPKNRGFATGLAIMGFGFAALIAGPLMQYLVANFGLVANFLFLGCVYIALISASALYLAPPPEAWLRANGLPVAAHGGKDGAGSGPDVGPADGRAGSGGDSKARPLARLQTAAAKLADHPRLARRLPCVHAFSAKEALQTWHFYALWWIFFLNISCGIALLAVASPMGQEVVGMTAAEAASMVGVIGLVNGGGRIFWSTVSDYVGRRNVYVLFFLLEAGAFYLLSSTTTAFLFQVLVLLIISCYGGGFSCMPAYLSDLFSTKELSAIHGKILTAWGLAGIMGPLALSVLYERTRSYSLTLSFFAGCFLLNLGIALVLKWRTSSRVILAQLRES